MLGERRRVRSSKVNTVRCDVMKNIGLLDHDEYLLHARKEGLATRRVEKDSFRAQGKVRKYL